MCRAQPPSGLVLKEQKGERLIVLQGEFTLSRAATKAPLTQQKRLIHYYFRSRVREMYKRKSRHSRLFSLAISESLYG